MCGLDIQLGGLEEVEVDGTRTEHGGDDVVEFAVGKTGKCSLVSLSVREKEGRGKNLLHSEAVAGALGEGNVVLLHGGSDVAEPPVGVELVGVGEDLGVRVLEVGGHADGDASGDDPLLELQGLVGRDTWAAVNGTEAQTISVVC